MPRTFAPAGAAQNGPSLGGRKVIIGACVALALAAALSGTPFITGVLAQEAAQQGAAKASAKAAKSAPKAAAKKSEADEGAAPAKKRDPAEAQRQIDNGIKLLQAGKNEPAIQTITSAIAGGNLPAPIMARALYHRGIAYRRTQKPGQAISDFTSALWFKGGLGEQERADALEQRSAAYREAGHPEQASDTKAARPSATAAAPAAAAAGTGVKTATAATLVPAQPQPQPGKSGSPPAPSWSAKTEVKAPTQAQSTPAAAAAAAPVTTAATSATAKASPPAAQGRFGARVALVRTKQEADALVVRLKKEFGSALEAREPEVVPVTFGGMGSFFQVRVAPFSTQEAAQSACTRLKGPGLDCVAVTR